MRLILLGFVIGILSGCASSDKPFTYHYVKPVIIEQNGSSFQYEKNQKNQELNQLESNDVTSNKSNDKIK
jgi:hypothetical protein